MMSRLSCLMVSALLFACAAGATHAQAPPTADQIIERLKSGQGEGAGEPRRTRGLSAPAGNPGTPPSSVNPASASEAPVGAPIEPRLDNLFVAPPGQISTTQRNEVAAIAQSRPTIDLTIYFDFNSSEISPQAIPTLVELGKALSSDALKGTRFLLAGHTDAKGSNAYNLRLSQRRAETIRRFLAAQFKVEEQRLLAIGYGEEQPKNTANPNADENRRVQVVNFGG
jgi:outer membrane protein OmpA-like peptidoglycan-associated protein